MEKTFALIKPDAVSAGNAHEIMQLLEMHGFKIIAQQQLQASFVKRSQRAKLNKTAS